MVLTEERFLQLMKHMNDEQVKNIEKKGATQLETGKEDLSGASVKSEIARKQWRRIRGL